MHSTTSFHLVATVIAGLLLPVMPASSQEADLSRLVVVGDSLSAGFQNGSLMGEQQVIKARDSKNVDHFAVENVAQEVIDARLAREQLNEMKNLINLRFGPGTWEFICY